MKNSNKKYDWDKEYWGSRLQKGQVDFTYDNWLDNYIELLNPLNTVKAIDLGCGIGLDTNFLLNEGCDVLSLDISQNALNELKSKIPNATTMQFDMSNTFPFDNENFNLVVANQSTHYYSQEDTYRLYQEINRILKSKGYFIGRVNSDKTIPDDVKKLIPVEPNFYIDKKNFRFFTEDDLYDLFSDWEIILLQEAYTMRWGREKALWEFAVKKR